MSTFDSRIVYANGIPWWSLIQAYSNQLVCVQVCLCVCVLPLSGTIVANLGNEVIFTSYHR